jgi:hypothetical protein
MVVRNHRALMDIRTRLPQQYDDLQGSGQKPGSKLVGLPCCAITVLYLRNSGSWPECTFSQRCGLRHAQTYGIRRILVEQSTGGAMRYRGHFLTSPRQQRRE